ncbi:aminodeoxychorismate/anthranilate synthase component II [Candidatus Peregrinibacteria bacterium RIFOXYA12_FULL_33_12]|nr:MAG: aminodeoxychorismate/anthranilate synthase component II [Candidatus Peregrinibacteria bacterium RIFOXYA12_FULL_33_12]OGJ45305.1 MAG: aminodeoxychorismate/anthranilate synthase component II [Candidatus Peregrinibacteria bacterium RIFOXYA2_FULL_33_21]OGJ50017.1 MAG: aminodeoxychorismate/anthranilate synthase component II [Candidatus Peregrinibacteria bacterium RIFOXYB2_FULL_33_20]
MKTLILDNYDSFTFNLYQYIGELGGNPEVFRNDELTLDQIKKMNFSHIVISPGPGTPERKEDFGVCKDVILELGIEIPLLGVCLGHQGIIHAFGGKIIRAPEIMHGKRTIVEHNGKNLFQNIENPTEVMRYHSLIGEEKSLPDCLEITARTKDKFQMIMAVAHKKFPIYGIQFHPESIGTPEGKKILKNFLEMYGSNPPPTPPLQRRGEENLF